MRDFGKWKDLAAVAVIVLTVILIYQKTLGNGFIYDDWGTIQKNIPIRTTVNPFYYFTNPWDKEDAYRPLEYIWFSLTYKFFGLNPLFFHLFSLVTHALSAVLLFILLGIIFENQTLAFLGALFFGVHPVNIEAVAWVTQQGGVLAMFFLLLTLVLAFVFKKEEWHSKPVRLTTLFLFSAFAVFFKEHAVILPALFLLIIFFKGESGGGFRAVKERWVELTAVAFPAVLSLVLRYMYLSRFTQMEVWEGGRYSIALTMLSAFKYYIGLIFWPDPLSVNYDLFPRENSIFNANVLGSAMLFLAILFLGIVLYKKAPIFALGVFMFFTALLPVSNVIFPMKQILNERFLYFAFPGFLMAVFGLFTPLEAALFKRVSSEARKRLLTGFIYLLMAASICYLAVFSYLTLRRLDDWKNDLALWKHELGVSRFSARTNNNYASTLLREGRHDEAILYFKKALYVASRADMEKPMTRLATAFYLAGKNDEAIKLIGLAMKNFPESDSLKVLLGFAYFQNEEYEEAKKIFRPLAEDNRDDLTAVMYAILSMAFNKDPEREIQREIDAIALEPMRRAMPDIIGARTEMKRGNWAKALEFLDKVKAEKDLPFIQSYLWRAEVLEHLGRFKEAHDNYYIVTVFNPDIAEAWQGINRLKDY